MPVQHKVCSSFTLIEYLDYKFLRNFQKIALIVRVSDMRASAFYVNTKAAANIFPESQQKLCSGLISTL